MEVRQIGTEAARAVIERKHYTKRLGFCWYPFGLFRDDVLIGVCCYGQPAASIQAHTFPKREFRIIELTRLVVDDSTSNGASLLVGRSLQMLDKPAAIISYADSAHGHVGIVYQATNWIYTGAVTAHDSLYEVGGELLHPMTLRDRFGVTNPAEWARENGYGKVAPQEKHRYFYFIGNRRERHSMRKLLRYKQEPYPKAAQQRYEAGPKCGSIVSLEADLFNV